MGDWITSATVYPAQDHLESPYGHCQATRAFSVQGWTEDQDSRFYYGALQLDCTIGNTTGYFGMRWQEASYDGLVVELFGYPNDKQPNWTMLGMQGRIADSYEWLLRYTIDTAPGQSGAPVYRCPACGTYCVIAVHASGGADYNYATRITESTFNNFKDWKVSY